MEILAIFTLLVLIAVPTKFISLYNSAKRLYVLRDEAFANIDVLQAKRKNLIEQLLRLLRGYNLHERDILSGIAKSLGEGNAAAVGKASFVERGAVLRMNFPDLKAEELYMSTMSSLSKIEKEMQFTREQVNYISKSVNTLIATFPNNYISKLFHMRPCEYLSKTEIGDLEEDLIRLAAEANSR